MGGEEGSFVFRRLLLHPPGSPGPDFKYLSTCGGMSVLAFSSSLVRFLELVRSLRATWERMVPCPCLQMRKLRHRRERALPGSQE